MSTVNKLLEISKKEIVNLKSGKVFLVCDLFKVYKLNCVSCSDRLRRGTLFLNYTKS
ncbi:MULTISPECIES: DUF1413 domain-containing protein [Clostridium]|uniref:DUF1413 domain-containing protein n=1 Tax=Clostridium TaxID=1485 RepID=UPI0015B6F471|nr:DUF1413 domain-containing protein [Clostridium sp.]NWK10775.1 DUF1413 domain-containing protein [Clostridium cadaveris]